MARLSHAPVDQRFIDDNEGTTSSGDNSSVSDCESVVSGTRIARQGLIDQNGFGGLVRLDEGDKLHGIIGERFVSRLSEVGMDVGIESIGRNLFNSSAIDEAKVGSFRIYTKAVEKKNGGHANVKYAWFGASKDEIDKIVVHGFGFGNMKKDRFNVDGIVLSADHSPLESMEAAIPDEDGIRHMLLCRVLLGKTEPVNADSMQCQSHPSSENFQSGVDDLVNPKKYIVWSSQMNTHILPEFVISFKNRRKPDDVRLKKPISPWIPIPHLIAALSKILPPKSIKDITQLRQSYIEHKISRQDMIRGIRRVTGDRLLLMVLKNFTNKRECHGFVV